MKDGVSRFAEGDGRNVDTIGRERRIMALTRDFKETVQARARRDSAFRRALLREGITCLVGGDVEAGWIVLRDYLDATIALAEQ